METDGSLGIAAVKRLRGVTVQVELALGAGVTALVGPSGVLEEHEPDQVGRVRLACGVGLDATAEDVAPGPVGLSLRPWEVVVSAGRSSSRRGGRRLGGEVVVSAERPAGSARNVVAGRVREVLPLGGRVRLVLAAGPDETLPLVAEITPEALDGLGCDEGQLLYAAFKATAMSVSSR